MARKKIALVLSGGVSLGSYIAGALDELMAALSSSEEYEIDIIAGASAGATTAAIIAHGLLYRNGKTALEDVWVKKVDIQELLDRELPDTEPLTLCSSRQLKKVAEETLSWNDPEDKGKRAAFCADRLVLAMTLSNTTALPYASRVEQPTADGKEAFVQFRHAEQETFFLNSAFTPIDPVWGRISNVARASSAIPFVFPPVPLARRADDERHFIHTPHPNGFQGEGTFWYYDGGTYNNLPVDLAWYYASLDPDNLDERKIVVINPWRSAVQPVNTAPQEPNIIQHALGLVAAMRQESSVIQFENEVLKPSRLEDPAADAEGLLAALPGVDRAPVEALENFALVMPREGDGRLRGNHLEAMGAFLDERFRLYDFRRGAADARRVIEARLGIVGYDAGRPEGFYDPDSDPALAIDVSTYEMLNEIPSARDSERSVSQMFESALRGRIGALVRRWDAPGPDFALDPLLSRFISDRAIEKLPEIWDN
jgi:predicted acylesterase/phospholipase RssA